MDNGQGAIDGGRGRRQWTCMMDGGQRMMDDCQGAIDGGRGFLVRYTKVT